MKPIRLFLVLALSLNINYSFAQKIPVKFGKIDQEHLEMTTYTADSSAEAVVLGDYGFSKFEYDQSEGFYFVFTRLTRIKVLTKEGLDWADFEIPYYNSSGSNERVMDLKGFTYNLENGKVEKEKLTKESIFDERTSKNWQRKKVTMPKVKEGSVIELSYKLKSAYFLNFQTWYFQKSIPVIWSEYIVSIPEYFHYQKLMQGYHPLAVNESSQNSGSMKFISKSRDLVKTTQISQETVNYRTNVNRWVAKDVPAFKSEPYITTSLDYISRIKFELNWIRYPNQPQQQIIGTWDNLNTRYLESETFGDQIGRTAFLKNEIEALADLPELERVAKITNMVKKQVEWDGARTRFTTKPFKKTYEDRKGTAADINLMLTGLLRRAGITADPILVSTRDHGRVRPNFAISDQFNYVISYAIVEGQGILLDATSKSLPPGVLPYRCLNGQGWRVSKSSPGWVKLNTKVGEDEIVQANLNLNEEGALSGSMTMMLKGYSSFTARDAIRTDGKEEYISKYKKNRDNLIIENFQFQNLEEAAASLKYTFDLESIESMRAGNMIYITPLLGMETDENPFKLEDREYPVDFGYPIKETIVISIEIPEGYIVEEAPERQAIALPNNAGKFQYSVGNLGNKLQITSIININQLHFVPTEYPNLKEFFSMIVAKQAEQIVLKKKT